jgi:hypothetical protein
MRKFEFLPKAYMIFRLPKSYMIFRLEKLLLIYGT